MAKNGNEPIIFEIQGSSPEPYIVKIGFEPFTISCSCLAGENGIPCRHRLSIVAGADPGIIKGNVSLLPKIKETAGSTALFDMIEKYDNAKNERKNTLKKAENTYKNYREARENFAFKKVKTDRAVIKRREALETAIDEYIETERAVITALKLLQTVFIRPSYNN